MYVFDTKTTTPRLVRIALPRHDPAAPEVRPFAAPRAEVFPFARPGWRDRAETAFPALPGGAAARILVIEAPHLLGLVDGANQNADVAMARMGDLDAALLARLAPQRIVFSLVHPDFDATEVLTRLGRLRYRGQVCVVTPALPDAGMVLAELRSFAPGLDVHLVQVAHP